MRGIFCKVVFSVLLIFVVGQAMAVHIKGGWIYYDFLGKDPTDTTILRYRVSLKLYRDCAPNQTQNDPQINITFFDGQSSQQLGQFTMPLVQTYFLSKTTPNPCITGDQSVCYTILFYETIVGFPERPGGYTLTFQRCCRIGGIINVGSPSNSYGNTYSTSIPGTQTNRSFATNSSARFKEQDTVLICASYPFELDYGANDADNDSLVYEFCPALNGGSTSTPTPDPSAAPPYNPIAYTGAFSANSPMGSGVVINRGTGLITGNAPGTPGEYVVSVCVKEYRRGTSLLKSETRKELHVKVANCNPTRAIPPPDYVTCDGFNYQFMDGSIGNIDSWFWDFGVLNRSDDTSTLQNPIWVYSDTGVYRVKLRIVSPGGCRDSAFMNLGVYPGYFPGFTNSPACANQPMQFTDTTRTRYGFVNSWRWDFGVTTVTDDTSRLRNPTYNYPAAGSYDVQFIVASNKGCIDTVNKQVTVLDRPPLNLPFRDTLICSIDTLPLIANGVGTFSWTPNVNILNSNTGNPLVWPVDSITYYVTLTQNGCVARDSVKVNVLDFIEVDLGPDSTICLTDTVQLNPRSFALSYRWRPHPSLSSTVIKRPLAVPTAIATTYLVNANLGKCQARDSVTIFTSPYPRANAGLNDTICSGESVQLSGNITGDRFTWSPTRDLSDPNSLNPIARPRVNTIYVLTSFNNTGCPKPFRDSVFIRVVPPVVAFAGNDTSIVLGQILQLNGTGGDNYTWTPSAFLNATNIANPKANITNPNVDTIRYRLRVLREGCPAEDDVLVKVFKTPPSIFVPTAFTPNGDGTNDFMRPIVVGMKSLDEFRIFNRWGKLVFESTNQKMLGWNGTVNNTPQKSEVYVWTARATDFNDKKVFAKGTCLLIR
jgi:gliding motility-associated-like protein